MSTAVLIEIDDAHDLVGNPPHVEMRPLPEPGALASGRPHYEPLSRRAIRGARALLQRLVDRLHEGAQEADLCPVGGRGHCIEEPVMATGGQGRVWRVYGRCVLCGCTSFMTAQELPVPRPPDSDAPAAASHGGAGRLLRRTVS
ncbi:MAG: hypothetical protein V2A58_03085 [Planctomycetota bacterium]